MELDSVEIADLIESPTQALEQAYDQLMEAIEAGIDATIEAAKELGVKIVEEGGETVRHFVLEAMTELRDAGFFDELAALAGEAKEIGALLKTGIEKIMELPPEQLVQIVALTAVAIFAPELLLANAELIAAGLQVANVLMAM